MTKLKTLIDTKKFNIVTLLLSLFDHVIVKTKKFTLTPFNEIFYCFSTDNKHEKFHKLLQCIHIKLNDKIYTNMHSFFTALKKLKSNEKYNFQIQYCYLIPLKNEITFRMNDKIISSKFLPCYLLQTCDNIKKTILLSIPENLYTDMMNHEKLQSTILSNLQKPIENIFDAFKCKFRFYLA